MTLEDNMGKIVTFTFTSSLFILFGLLSYATLQDYFMYPVYQIAETLVSSGVSQGWVLTSIEGINEIVQLFPSIMDWLWLLTAVALVSELFISSYFIKRRGYFSLLSLMFWGTLVMLFIMNVYLILTDWVLEEILYNLIPALSYSTPFFNYYILHAGIINTIIIVTCIILNFVDFDFSTYFQRKEKETQVTGNSLGDEVA